MKKLNFIFILATILINLIGCGSTATLESSFDFGVIREEKFLTDI